MTACNDRIHSVSGGDIYVFFFFQAEDGIRDLTVTGVQTCALPIFAKNRKLIYREAKGVICEREGHSKVVQRSERLWFHSALYRGRRFRPFFGHPGKWVSHTQ